jgi:hypothetical protein
LRGVNASSRGTITRPFDYRRDPSRAFAHATRVLIETFYFSDSTRRSRPTV